MVLPALSDEMDSDVKEEAKKINSMAVTEVLDHNLIMTKVTKKYGKSIAVNQLSVGINE